MFVSQWGIYICDFYLHSILSHRSYMRLRNRLTSGYIPIACIEQTYLTSFSLSPPPNAFGAHRAALYYSVSVKNCAKRTPKTFISIYAWLSGISYLYIHIWSMLSLGTNHMNTPSTYDLLQWPDYNLLNWGRTFSSILFKFYYNDCMMSSVQCSSTVSMSTYSRDTTAVLWTSPAPCMRNCI